MSQKPIDGTGEPSLLPTPHVASLPDGQTWQPRPANALTFPLPTCPQTIFGRPRMRAYRYRLYDTQKAVRMGTNLLEAVGEHETACQSVERVFARRALLPLTIEAERLELLAKVVAAEQTLGSTIREQAWATEDEVIARRRKVELEALRHATERLEAEKNRLILKQELAEQQAKTRHAPQVAELKAEAEEVDAERALHDQARRLQRAQARTSAEDEEDTDDALPEVRKAKAHYAKIMKIRKDAQKDRDAVLAQVDGDESRLSPRQREELAYIERWSAKAEEDAQLADAAAIIYPCAGDEE